MYAGFIAVACLQVLLQVTSPCSHVFFLLDMWPMFEGKKRAPPRLVHITVTTNMVVLRSNV